MYYIKPAATYGIQEFRCWGACRYLLRNTERDFQNPCFMMSSSETPRVQAMEKAFFRMSCAREIVPGSMKLIALQSQNLKVPAFRGADEEGLMKRLRWSPGFGRARSDLTAATGQRDEAGRIAGILILDGVWLAFWFLYKNVGRTANVTEVSSEVNETEDLSMWASSEERLPVVTAITKV